MMDGFSIIQSFFTRMRCHFCSVHLEPEGVQLIRHDKGVYVVNVHCTHCSKQMGVALVGLESAENNVKQKALPDVELTEQDFERLARFDAINYDDVIEAHRFFGTLDEDWTRFIPEEMRQLEIRLEPESEVA